MYSYELTERGKTIIAVVLVVILVVLSAVILTIGYCSGTSLPSQGDDSSISKSPPAPVSPPAPQETLSPPPSEPPPTEPPPTEPPPTDPPPSAPPHGGNGNGHGYGDIIPEFGPVGLNILEGTMLFMFSPSLQEALDDDTVTMLSDFLSSPKNTDDSQIQVEMPNLAEDDMDLLLSAVAKAFSTYNVKVNDIVYVTNQTEVADSNFEVKLSFYVAPEQK